MTLSALDYARRNDTMLGVCEALGDQLGIGANWFRIAFAAAFFFFPLQAIGVYLGLFGLVALTLRLAPDVMADPVAPTAAVEEVKLAA